MIIYALIFLYAVNFINQVKKETVKMIYTRPSGKTFEVIKVISVGKTKTWVQYKEGKYIVEQAVWNKNLTK